MKHDECCCSALRAYTKVYSNGAPLYSTVRVNLKIRKTINMELEARTSGERSGRASPSERSRLSRRGSGQSLL